MLEQAIMENTQAIKALHAFLQNSQLHFGAPTPAPSPEPKWYPGGEVLTESVDPEPIQAPVKKEEPTPEPTKPAVKVEEPAAEISYDQVASKLIALAKAKGREAAISLLADFNAKSGKDLKTEQYSDVISHIDTLLGE